MKINPPSNQTEPHAIQAQRPYVRFLGFTLVEILVVMVIIGITFGMAILAFGDFGEARKIQASAEEFAQFLQMMHEHSLLESTTLQIQLNSSSYRCRRLNEHNQWKTFNNNTYRPHALAAKTKIMVAYGSKKSDELVIIMSSSGDMTPFKVYFGSPSQAYLVSVIGNDNGHITVNPANGRN